MSRLEVSICRAAIDEFSPWNPSIKTEWHTKMTKAMYKLMQYVLNDSSALTLTYRSMSIPKLINRLC